MGMGVGLGAEGELVSPLLMAPVHIDPSCLHPDLLKEVQHVVIAREQLLLHLNQVIGRGQSQAWFRSQKRLLTKLPMDSSESSPKTFNRFKSCQTTTISPTSVL